MTFNPSLPSCLSVFLLLSTFSSACSALIVGNWSLDWTAVQCTSDGAYCNYKFQITEGVDDSSHNTTQCAFTISRWEGIPAQSVNFTDMACEDTDAYRINGSWDHEGFITMCVSHAAEDAWAFFAYQARQIIDANATWAAVQPAYKIHTFNRTMARRDLLLATDDGPAREKSLHADMSPAGSLISASDVYWSIGDLKHNLTQNDPDGVWTWQVSFLVVATEVSSEGNLTRYNAVCSMLEEFDDVQNATLASVHEQPCSSDEDAYEFSWYPCPTSGAAWLVLTNPGKARRLVVGVSGLNDSEPGAPFNGGPFRPQDLDVI